MANPEREHTNAVCCPCRDQDVLIVVGDTLMPRCRPWRECSLLDAFGLCVDGGHYRQGNEKNTFGSFVFVSVKLMACSAITRKLPHRERFMLHFHG